MTIRKNADGCYIVTQKNVSKTPYKPKYSSYLGKSMYIKNTRDNKFYFKEYTFAKNFKIEPAKPQETKEKNYSTCIVPDWSANFYMEERVGASTIFNYGQGADKQSASLSTDILFGARIQEEETKGIFFDVNGGIRYNSDIVQTPNTHRGGFVGGFTFGYKMPISDNVTFDNYITGEGSYCNSGNNALNVLDHTFQHYEHFGPPESLEEDDRTKMQYLCQLEKYLNNTTTFYDVPDGMAQFGNVHVRREDFNGNIREYDDHQLGDKVCGGQAIDPRLNPYSLKGGIGTGFTINIKPEKKNHQFSMYFGAEAGLHKTGPKFEVESDVKYYYADSDAQKTHLIVFDNADNQHHIYYTNNVHEKNWYVTPKVKLSCLWDKNSNQKEISLSADEHGVFLGFKADLKESQKSFGNTKRRPF